VVVGAPSLAYPPSWDMSVHIYVAREWLARGAMPYRDTFDHKGPGLYALHALALRLFGDAMWGYRLLELAMVFALGVVCAWLAAPASRRPEPGVVGVSVFAANVFAFGFLDYWNTAQGELACALLTTAGVLATRRVEGHRTAAVVAGLLGGAATLVKPTALPLVAISAFVMARRARRDGRAGTLRWFGGALLALPALTVAYFALRGALPAAVDSLVFANRVYVLDEHTAHGARGALHAIALALRHFGFPAKVVIACAIAGPVLSRLRRRRFEFECHALAAAMLLVGFATVVMQWKFFLYHWSIAAGGVVLVAANWTVIARRLFGTMRAPFVAAPVVAVAIWLAFVRTGNEDWALWRDNAQLTARWAAGAVDDDTFAQRIAREPGKRDYRSLKAIAEWIRERTRPDDYILVRGESAEIYVLSGRRAPGRFFWSLFLSSPTRAYHREAWLREDALAIATHPPRYVVVRTAAKRGPDSAAWFAPLGYRVLRTCGAWAILGHRPPRRDLEARKR
jgi:hypothetical protein